MSLLIKDVLNILSTLHPRHTFISRPTAQKTEHRRKAICH